MRKLRKTVILCALLAAAVFAPVMTGCGKVYRAPDYNGGDMIIGTWFGPMGFSANQEGIQELKDAGVNLGITNFMPSEPMLDIAQGIGFKILPYYKEWQKGFSAFDSYKSHPALFGLNVWDEPNLSDFTAIKAEKEQFDKLMPADKTFFVNLYPGYAPGANIGGSFEAYVEGYLEEVEPPIVSFDHYPLKIDSGKGTVEINDSWFQEIEVMRHAAKKYGDIPMWSIILCSGHGALASPTLADMRWQMAVNMTFGVSGIVHYTYPQEGADYKSMVTLSGERTFVFDLVQEANLEIRKWDNIYTAFDWQGTAEVDGRNGRYKEMMSLAYAKEIKDVEGIESVVSSENMLLGEFNGPDGNKGFMLTNAVNPFEERFAIATVKFDKQYKAVVVYEKGEPRVINLKKGEAQIRLDAGEGKFLIPLK